MFLAIGKHFICAGTYANIFSEVCPANGTALVNQKLCGSRIVTSVRAALAVEQTVLARYRSIKIGEDREGISGFLPIFDETCGGSTLMATGRTPALVKSDSCFSTPRT